MQKMNIAHRIVHHQHEPVKELRPCMDLPWLDRLHQRIRAIDSGLLRA
jgi:hypothetical protein